MSSSGIPGDAGKKMKCHKKYSSEWEDEPEFHGWLKASSKGSSYYFCSACKAHLSLNAGKVDIRRHAVGKKHTKNLTMASGQRSVLDLPSVSGNQSIERQVKEGEIRLASFICEHDIPIRVVDHIPQLLHAICPDSQIAKNMKCGRTKLTSVVNNVTGKQSKHSLVTHLQKNKFSLIVDESTDKGCTKHLCMLVRTLMDDEVKDCFLGLFPLQDATAIVLYNNVVSVFRENQIDYKQNMIGFAADGANVMLGSNNSLASHLRKDIDGLFVFKCICHSFALCASDACLKLPGIIEDLARDVFSYFQCSPKRAGSFQEFQRFINVKPHKLLHPSQTRWLSLQMVVSRLLEQYDALTLYFTEAAFTEQLHSCDNILQILKDPLTKLYFQFLDFVLPIFNSLNRLMQSGSTQIHVLCKEVSISFKTLLDCYLDDKYLEKTPLSKIALSDPRKLKPLTSIYLGAKVGMTLSQQHNIPPHAIKEFKQNCLAFYIEGATQIRTRFAFNDVSFKQLEALDPRVVKDKSLPSLAPLMSSFPTLVNDNDIQNVDNEWQLLRQTELVNEGCSTPLKFWLLVRDAKSGNGDPMFPNLSRLMLNLLCLPHSSATVERVFSAVNRQKTKLRNRLSIKTLSGILHTKRLLEDKSCFNFPISTKMVHMMQSEIYKKECAATGNADDSDEDVV